MPTHLLHRAEPTRFEFPAEITAVHPGGVVELRATAFYARSGGQVGDTGSIGDVPVLDTVFDPAGTGVVHHVCDPELAASLSPGSAVDARVDRLRRERVMALHTAQHLLFLATERVIGPGSLVGGGDIAVERARIDVAWPAAAGGFPIEEVRAAVARLVEADLPIERTADAADPDRWWWRIDGHAAVPCGGTHVAHTGLVGPVEVVANRKGSRAVRVTVTQR
ncbi:MAG: Threonyl/alanyl tRNA synthetase [Actinomycetia bacterium]|nr:Threonyl/alanyl tRNA synthetase [Actinomycetes bacterium]